MANFIKKIIRNKKKENKHTFQYIADSIGVPAPTIASFFRSKKGDLDIACAILSLYNLSIIEIFTDKTK
ncbi:MAG: hypothetical protein OEL54_01685 [Flavobacteriaceae bacterium]|nr:hypothetical protein [Flavobacteriaceae bacterium]